jgi:hypothetical protein
MAEEMNGSSFNNKRFNLEGIGGLKESRCGRLSTKGTLLYGGQSAITRSISTGYFIAKNGAQRQLRGFEILHILDFRSD